MSTAEQRKRLKQYNAEHSRIFAEWAERGYEYPPPERPLLPDDLRGLTCGAKTRAGTPCKLKAIYANCRCKWHGGLSTGPSSAAGKKRSAMNGFCPKKKRSQRG